jgi:hypothetical protein
MAGIIAFAAGGCNLFLMNLQRVCATMRPMRLTAAILMVGALSLGAAAQKRLVLIDQDGSGPGGSNQMAMLALLQAPQVEVLASPW